MSDTTESNAAQVPGDAHSTDASYRSYVHDQLQQARTVVDHGAVLQHTAAHRVARAKKVVAHDGGSAVFGEAATDAGGGYHMVERMLDEQAFYPAHDKRKESPEYARVHHQMTVVDDKHCLVCGVQHSTLGDLAKNPFGAIQMETHHHTIEWALANAIDPAKFNQHIRPGLLHAAQRRAQEASYAKVSDLYKAFDQAYESDLDIATIKQWVDHATDNLWVLCDVHHRHKFVGIHAITYPIWGPQDVVDAGLVDKQIQVAKSAGGATV